VEGGGSGENRESGGEEFHDFVKVLVKRKSLGKGKN